MNKNILIFIMLTLVGNISFPQVPQVSNCKAHFKDGSKFKYKFEGTDSVILVDGDYFIERSEKANFETRSKMEWTSECSFRLTVESIKGGQGGLQVGDVVEVNILKIMGNEIAFESVFKDEKMNMSYIKL